MPLDPHAAASPVDWMEWGPAAFERARAEDRPILLRISAVWCHWCHVMDETTDADPEVARRMNEWFVPVRVDNDERPDVNDRYNLGGWPTTAFLTPDGEVITGGTYFPAARFRQILERVHEAWVNERDALGGEVRRLEERRRKARAERAAAGGEADGDAVARIVEGSLDAYDWRYGGFGTEPKFPQPEAVRLLLHAHAGSGADQPRQAAEKTLVLMRTAGEEEGRNYGLYDHAAGGFFRYSTTRDWSEPHFEKMAEDNARLAMAYLDAWRLTGDDLYAGTVRGIFGYVLATLSDPAGGAYGSQDADGEADYYGLPIDERAERGTPFVDRRFYAEWNGMAVVAALDAAHALDWLELRDWALRTVDRLDAALATPDGSVRRVLRPDTDGGDPAGPLLLADQAWWARALLAAYQATGEPRYRARAETVIGFAEDAFLDADRGAFLDRPADADAEGHLAEPHVPLAANAAMAEALLDHAALGGGERWGERAAGVLGATRGDALRHGVHGAAWGLAAARALAEPLRVHLVGPAADPALRALLRAARRPYAPGLVVEVLDPDAGEDRLADLRYPAVDGPRAYVCVGTRCLEPVDDPDALVASIAAAREEPPVPLPG